MVDPMTFKTIYSEDVYPSLVELLKDVPRIQEKKPIKALYYSPKTSEAKESIEIVKERISLEFHIENVIISDVKILPNFVKIDIIPNEKQIKKRFKKNSNLVLEVIKMLDPLSLMEEFEKGPVVIPLGKNKEAEITKDDIKINLELPENVLFKEDKFGFIFLDLALDDALEKKITANDASESINHVKKKANIPEEKQIKLFIKCPDSEIENIVKSIRQEIRKNTNALELWILTPEKKHDWDSHKYYGTIKIKEKEIEFAIDVIDYM